MIASRRIVPAVRGGFTLIELLVVISIMALLAALIGAGAQRMRVAGQRQATQDIVSKLQVGLDNQVAALVEQVRKDRTAKTPEFTQMMAFAGNNEDRAEALMAYCRLRQNFPQAASELGPRPVNAANAAAPMFFLRDPATGLTISFRRPRSFDALYTAGMPDPTNADEEAVVSSALLYAALASREYGGLGFASDDATAGAQAEQQLGSAAARYYKDAFGKPTGFRRFGTNAEMQNAPYTNAKDNRKDPFDPQALLTVQGWPGGPASNQVTGHPNRNVALVVFYAPGQGGYTGGADAIDFTGSNRLPTVYSAGENRAYENLGGDDVLGYRLRQLGSKGVKR